MIKKNNIWSAAFIRLKNMIPFNMCQMITITVIVGGIFLWLSEYLINRSLWFDEAMLSVNVINSSYFEIFSQKEIYDQSAPIGFLLLAKLVLGLFGNSEYALRLLPILFSASALVLFFYLLKQISNKWAASIALLLFVSSKMIMRYSTEFKPYSGDVFFALVILLLGFKILSKKFDIKDSYLFGIVGDGACWFSFPSVFTFIGVTIALLYSFLSKKKTNELKFLFISIFIWGISFSIHYVWFLKTLEIQQGLQDHWSQSFIPLLPGSFKELSWLVSQFIMMFDYYPGTIIKSTLGSILFIMGSCAVLKRDRSMFLFLTMPLIITLIASGLNKYPFQGRLLLFYRPCMYLLIAEGIFYLINKKWKILQFLGIAFIVGIICLSVANIQKYISKRVIYGEEIKSVLVYIKENIKKDDILYIYWGAKPAFDYYAPKLEFDRYEYVLGKKSISNFNNYKLEIDKLKKNKRVWFVFSHIHKSKDGSEKNLFIKYLDSIGTLKDAAIDINVAVCLYEFS